MVLRRTLVSIALPPPIASPAEPIHTDQDGMPKWSCSQIMTSQMRLSAAIPARDSTQMGLRPILRENAEPLAKLADGDG